MWVPHLQDVRDKYSDSKVMCQEETKTLHEQPPMSTGSVSHFAYSLPLVRSCPGAQPCHLHFVPRCCLGLGV